MNNQNQSDMCICGRNFVHCKTCGKRTVNFKKFRSFEMNQNVYSCQKCGNETLETTQECKAPPYVRKHTFKAEEKPQFTLNPDSYEYAVAYINRREFLIKNHTYPGGADKLDEGMRKEGWIILPENATYENGWLVKTPIKDDIQTNENNKDNELPFEPETLSGGAKELTLDEVIEQMKKEQGG